MACAGTLSWSVAGMVAPKAATPPGRNRLVGTPVTSPRREVATNQAAPKGPGYDTAAETSRKLGETPRTPITRHGQELRTMTPDALEIDWSHVVRRCMDGDSGA